MKSGDVVFVYGTLRKGERADLSKKSVFSVSFLGFDSVNGYLYHFGAYPGLKLLEPLPPAFDDSLPMVRGEVYLINDASVGAMLDAYEGYRANAPKEGLYDRHVVETLLGRNVWVYTWNSVVTDDQLIETGDWKNPRLIVTKRIPRTG
jgi:gamma-glutamylcyclotransferase (GGCT)/AIG2-like uncharacterized protein YtfP